VRRFAQDDGFVEMLEYNWLNMQKTQKDLKMTILWEFQKLQGELFSLRSFTQLENLLPLRLQPANRIKLILFSNALFKAVNRLHRQKAPCSANLKFSRPVRQAQGRLCGTLSGNGHSRAGTEDPIFIAVLRPG
jgi:hypothetical protein